MELIKNIAVVQARIEAALIDAGREKILTAL